MIPTDYSHSLQRAWTALKDNTGADREIYKHFPFRGTNKSLPTIKPGTAIDVAIAATYCHRRVYALVIRYNDTSPGLPHIIMFYVFLFPACEPIDSFYSEPTMLQ